MIVHVWGLLVPFGEYAARTNLLSALLSAAVRPVTPAYADVSLAIAKEVSPPTQIQTNGFVDSLRGTLKDALNSQALL